MNTVLDFLLGVTGLVLFVPVIYIGYFLPELVEKHGLGVLIGALIVSCFIVNFSFDLMDSAGWLV